MSALTEQVKELAQDGGFAAVGITHPDKLENLPHGWVGQVRQLQRPDEELPSVKSIIVMAFHLWDRIFNLNVTAPRSVSLGEESSVNPFHEYFFTYEIMKNKAWRIIDFLQKNGFKAKYSVGIPLKPIAVQCGLGWQGKNTLLITPQHGPRVNLIAVLTDAELEPDSPFLEDLCGECNKCMKACPAKALSAYQCQFNRCLVYSLECPDAPEVPETIQRLEERLTPRPTSHSYLECSICMDVCPFGKPAQTNPGPAKMLKCPLNPLVL
jgi:epoxyqueuosine reductase